MFVSKASQEDHVLLTKLTVESKSYWDYSKEQIQSWLPDLTITESYIESNQVFKMSVEDKIVGYYSFFSNDSQEIILDNLFVDPDSIGKGFGRELLFDFFEKAKRTKCARALVYSDPNSEKFYTHFGFEVIGKEPTSIKNRFLPILSKLLR